MKTQASSLSAAAPKRRESQKTQAKLAAHHSHSFSFPFAAAEIIRCFISDTPTPFDNGNAERGISIPRLETQALYLLARTVEKIKQNLEIDITNITLWTDSTTTIQWLQSCYQKETFVRNRIQHIKSYVVKHIKTSENPADIASRGCTLHQLKDSNLWFNGPSWLILSEEEWPQCEFIYIYQTPNQQRLWNRK